MGAAAYSVPAQLSRPDEGLAIVAVMKPTTALRRYAAIASILITGSGCLASTLPSETSDHPPGEIPTHKVGGDGRANPGDAPEISRSGGERGGVVVMWPRVIPKDDPEARDLAGKVQQRLKELAKATFPDAPIEVRPEPERVCAQSGCDGVALGAVVTKRERGCAVIVVVGAPGPTPLKLVPWLGVIKQKGEPPFREPPESYITIQEYGDCGKLADDLSASRPIGEGDGPVAAALTDAMRASK